MIGTVPEQIPNAMDFSVPGRVGKPPTPARRANTAPKETLPVIHHVVQMNVWLEN